MIVWGGFYGTVLNDGGRYNPTLNSWTAVRLNGAPAARGYHTAVWTGSEMIVWGGYNGDYFNDGGRYNPVGNSWTALTTNGAPIARFIHTAVWTGSEMIVWGRSRCWPPAQRWRALQSGGGQLDARDHLGCPLTAHPANGRVDGQRDDRLGWIR